MWTSHVSLIDCVVKLKTICGLQIRQKFNQNRSKLSSQSTKESMLQCCHLLL
jgi:hypothetical protein